MTRDQRRADEPEGVEALEDILASRGEPPTAPRLPVVAPTQPIPRAPAGAGGDDDTAPRPAVPMPPDAPAVGASRPARSSVPAAGQAGVGAGARQSGAGRRTAGLSPFALVAMLVAAVLAGALIMGLFQILGSPEQAAAPTTTTVTRTPEPTTTGDPSPSTTSPTKSTPTSKARATVDRTGAKPAAVKRVCAGSWKGARVGVGTTSTTCGFAEQVRKAYIDGGGDGSKTSIRAKSPATGKTYTMSCSGAKVTRCTGGRNAVVYLY